MASRPRTVTRESQTDTDVFDNNEVSANVSLGLNFDGYNHQAGYESFTSETTATASQPEILPTINKPSNGYISLEVEHEVLGNMVVTLDRKYSDYASALEEHVTRFKADISNTIQVINRRKEIERMIEGTVERPKFDRKKGISRKQFLINNFGDCLSYFREDDLDLLYLHQLRKIMGKSFVDSLYQELMKTEGVKISFYVKTKMKQNDALYQTLKDKLNEANSSVTEVRSLSRRRK